MARAAILLILSWAVAGCAVIEKVNTDGTVERTSAFLAPIVFIDGKPEASRVVRASGLGLGIGPNLAVLGTYDVAAAQLDGSCRLVIMPKSELEVQNLRRILGDDPNICVPNE